MKSVDITTLPNYETIPLGTHKLTVTAQADGYTDSDPSAEVTFINGYALTVQNNNCTYSPHQSMIAVFEDTVLTFNAATGYNLPDTVTVTNASHTWDKSTGKLTITNVTGAVAVTVTATQPQLATPTNVSATGTVLSWDAVENAESYDIYAGETLIGNTDGNGYAITTTITNGTYSGDSRVLPGGTATVTITANDGYALPDSVTVTGATGSWNKTTGTLSISNPTGNVTVTGKCVATKFTIAAGTYKFIAEPVIPFDTNISEAIDFTTSDSDHPSLNENEMYVVNDNDSLKNIIRYYMNTGGVVHAYRNGVWEEGSLRTIKIASSQTVSSEWYNWAITSKNLVKQ